jgi:hypothetical protein
MDMGAAGGLGDLVKQVRQGRIEESVLSPISRAVAGVSGCSAEAPPFQTSWPYRNRD